MSDKNSKYQKEINLTLNFNQISSTIENSKGLHKTSCGSFKASAGVSVWSSGFAAGFLTSVTVPFA